MKFSLPGTILLSRIFLLSFYFGCYGHTIAQNEQLDQCLPSLRETLPQMMDSADIPGLAITLIQDSIVWEQGFGFKNGETQTIVHTNTVFEAASLSKPVFAYIVMKLVEKGKINLDIPLTQYVPRQQLAQQFLGANMTDRRLSLITARMVLTHSSGFPNWRPRGGSLSISHRPGSAYSYSGEGFIYLQTVIEHIMHRPLNKLARTYVFDPLGMQNSSFIWQSETEAFMAHGHNEEGKVFDFRKQSHAGAAYSLLTTTTDYAKFVIALLKGTGLSQEQHKDMLRAHISTGYGAVGTFSWGLGLGLQETPKGTAFWHWGDNGIFKCFMLGIPSQDIGIVYFTNSANGLNIGKNLLRQTLGIECPTFELLGYDQYDSPVYLLGKQMATEGIISGMRLYHQLKSAHTGDSPLFGERALNALGYRLLQRQKLAEAIEVFKIQVEQFPDSWNAYDSLAEAYMQQGKRELAIINYERSLRLNPHNENGRKMLSKIHKAKE